MSAEGAAVSRAEIRLARLMEQYGPRWGYEVPAGVRQIAEVDERNGVATAEHASRLSLDEMQFATASAEMVAGAAKKWLASHDDQLSATDTKSTPADIAAAITRLVSQAADRAASDGEPELRLGDDAHTRIAAMVAALKPAQRLRLIERLQLDVIDATDRRRRDELDRIRRALETQVRVDTADPATMAESLYGALDATVL